MADGVGRAIRFVQQAVGLRQQVEQQDRQSRNG